MPYDSAAAVGGVLAKAAQNAGGLEQANRQTGGEASAFDVWTHSYEGMSARLSDFADDPVGALQNYDRDLDAAVEAGLGGDWHSSSFDAVGDSVAAQAAGLGDMVSAIGEAEGALATVGATFALLTGVEQMLSTLVSVIPFPSLPAIRVGDMDIGLPHAHSHPPNLVPPAPPVPLPSTGPIIPIPILSGAARTLINGMPAARCGDMGLGIWCGGYFPMYEVFLGSSNVWIEGARAGRLAVDITKHCIFTSPKPSDPPLGPMVGVTTMGSTNVLIGGVPMPSLLSLGIGAAMKGLMRGLGKAARGVERSTRSLRQRLLRNTKPGFLKCRLLRAEPVDVVTGEVVVDQEDFSIPGRIPLTWTRHFRSSSNRMGVCGRGWETPADARLAMGADGTVTFHDGAGVPTHFIAPPVRRPVLDTADGMSLSRETDGWAIRNREGLCYFFENASRTAGEWLIHEIRDQFGNSITFRRDENGLKRIEESAGRTIDVDSRDGRIRQMNLRQPGDATGHPLLAFDYDEAGRLCAVWDALRVPYGFEYSGNLLIRHTDRNGLSFHYEYDDACRCTRAWGDGGLYDYSFTYDERERRTRFTDSLGHAWQVGYDGAQQLTEEVDPLGGVTCYAYDDAGRTSTVIDADGNRTSYQWDDRGNLIVLQRADGTTIEAQYDAAGRCIRITDGNGAAWRQEWTEQGRLRAQTGPADPQSRYEFEYDDLGQLRSFVSPRGGRAHLSYDPFGNLVSFVDALGFQTRFRYGPLGEVTDKLDAVGGHTRYQHDAKGRIVGIRLPGGTAATCTYDGEGNLTAYRDPDGGLTRTQYLGMGLVRRRDLANGNVISFAYDTEERLVAVRNANGEEYRIIRDPLGRVIEEVDYWGGARTYAYSAAGHLRRVTDPRGRSTAFDTDAMGRIVRKRHSHDDGEPHEETYAYDGNGNLIGCDNRAIHIERIFDDEGRLVQETSGDQYVVRNVYDAAGNRVLRELQMASGIDVIQSVVRYEYDLLGRATCTEVGADRVMMERDGLGRIVRERRGRRLVRALQYTEPGFLARDETAVPAGPVLGIDYAHDQRGNTTKRHDPELGEERFVYDATGQLLGHADGAGRRHDYRPTPAGDRWVAEAPRMAASGGTSLRHMSFGSSHYTFDAAGALIRVRSPLEDVRLHWGSDGRLERSETNGASVDYTYDPLGRRIAKSSGTNQVRFAWDGDVIAGEVSVTGPEERDADSMCWVCYPDTFVPLVAEWRRWGGRREVAYFQNSTNGYPIRLLSPEGLVLWAATHSAWGAAQKPRDGAWRNPLRLQGQYGDPETGFHFTRQRYYDPGPGAFITQDPLRLAAGINLYAFAPNPHAWIDPYGLSCYFDAGVGRWRNRQTGRFQGVPNDPADLVHGGRIDFDDVQAWAAAHGLPNQWTPSATFPAGGFRHPVPGGGSIHGHGVNPNAAANFPGSNSATGPTASIRNGAGQNFRTDGTWGTFGSNPNGAHIPLDNSPY